MRLSVVRNPASGRVDPELLLDLGHVEAHLPPDRLGALASRILRPAHQHRLGARLDAHGFITILSASRRSYTA